MKGEDGGVDGVCGLRVWMKGEDGERVRMECVDEGCERRVRMVSVDGGCEWRGRMEGVKAEDVCVNAWHSLGRCRYMREESQLPCGGSRVQMGALKRMEHRLGACGSTPQHSSTFACT